TGGGGQVTGGGGQVTGGGGALPSLPDRELPRASHRRRGEGVHVAVLDTPVYDPSAFPNVSYHDDTRPHSEPLPYEAGHAAFIVGLIAREASEAHVHVYPVLDAYATGSSWEIAKRMARLPEEVSIANLSFGCYTIDDKPPLVLQRAIEVLTPRVIVIAAAGNHRQPMRPRPFWPAAMDNVVAVGALDGDREADFSPRAPWVGAMAQGVDVISNYLNGEVDVAGTDVKFHGFAQWQGTSFAAATVSGQVAAHLAGRQSGWRAREVLAELMARADGDAGVRPSRFRPRHGG
ncbi:MAG: S8/S53 family peptidase, partial [Actinomycetota bacterium]